MPKCHIILLDTATQTQKFPFLLLFRLAAGGVGGAAKNWKEIFEFAARAKRALRSASAVLFKKGSRKGYNFTVSNLTIARRSYG